MIMRTLFQQVNNKQVMGGKKLQAIELSVTVNNSQGKNASKKNAISGKVNNKASQLNNNACTRHV
jgi:hypothetical protein